MATGGPPSCPVGARAGGPPGWPAPAHWWEDLRRAEGDADAFALAARALSPRQLYLLSWDLLHLKPFQPWCRHHSEGRRWLPTDGGEWALFSLVRDPIAAFHICAC